VSDIDNHATASMSGIITFPSLQQLSQESRRNLDKGNGHIFCDILRNRCYELASCHDSDIKKLIKYASIIPEDYRRISSSNKIPATSMIEWRYGCSAHRAFYCWLFFEFCDTLAEYINYRRSKC